MSVANQIQGLHDTNHHKRFGKKLLSIVPHLHPYTKHRLYIAESVGILPKNMYCSNDVIDEAIVTLYSDNFDPEIETLPLELQLFKIVDLHIDALYIQEGWHQKSISTTYFLKQELEKLEQFYIVEGNNKYIMKEDLEDICYRQNIENKQSFIYSDQDSEIFRAINSEETYSLKKQKLLGKFYSWLPIETSKIIDLFVFGKLNFEEISIVMNLAPQEVKETIIDVRKSFRKNLL